MNKPDSDTKTKPDTEKKIKHESGVEEVLELSRQEKLNEEDILRQALEQRQRKLEDAESRAQDFYRQLLSLKADFDNYRKRSEREKEQRYLHGKMAVLEQVIGLYDTFTKGLASLPVASSDAAALVDGIRLLYREFEQMLAREGVRRMECAGMPFDPGRHEVMDSEVRDDVPDGTITAVLSDGFTLQRDSGDLVLRAARVRVSRSKTPEAREPAETAGPEAASH
jgi:molecular chaperone GrpE